MNRNESYSRRGFVGAALGLLSSAHALAEEPRVEIPSYNKMTDKQEISLGRETAQGIEKDKNLKFVETRTVRDYVDDVFQKITKRSRRPNLPYSIKIVDTKEIYAFALPGGFVYLNRGLIEWARSESEIVATLSHEVGHVVGRHGANAISRGSAMDSLLSEASQVIFGDDLPARLLKQAGGPVEFLAMMKYGRTQELEADLFGYYNMQRAGWDPKGMIELFRHFGESSSVLDPLFTITESHPPASERESQIADEMRELPPTRGLTYNSESFKEMQAELKNLPSPKVQEKLFDN
jgi:predicted Zn-dependent protease